MAWEARQHVHLPTAATRQVVPSLGAVKVLHRRLAAAEGPEGPPAFPVLATRWAGAHKGKTYTDQVKRQWERRGRGCRRQVWLGAPCGQGAPGNACRALAGRVHRPLPHVSQFPPVSLLPTTPSSLPPLSLNPPQQVLYDRVTRQQALATLREHLTANLVRLRRRWCAQACGIAQGSTLSTLLCRWARVHRATAAAAPPALGWRASRSC